VKTRFSFGALSLALAACGGEPDATPALTGTADGARPAAIPYVSGIVSQRVLGSAVDRPLAGVEVCALGRETPVCSSSDDEGVYELGPLTPNSLNPIRYAKAGFIPLITQYAIAEHSTARDAFLVSENDSREIAAATAGVAEWRDSAGIVVLGHLITYDGIVPLPALSARLADGSALVYPDAQNRLGSGLTATSERGWAVALGLQPGPIELEISGPRPQASCFAIPGSSGQSELAVALETLAGHLTLVEIYCFQ
jgi:hypothetical protein